MSSRRNHLLMAALACARCDASASDGDTVSPEILVEEAVGSRFHENATWWGYNQSKIARRGDAVFIATLDNDVSEGEPYRFIVSAKYADSEWAHSSGVPASRPGNIVIGPEGALHAFVFEPFDMAANDSIGRLQHYTFPDPLDLTTSTLETIVDTDGTSETVNIRIGASVSPAGQLAVAWGINRYADDGQSVEVYVRNPGESTWTLSLAGTQLEHDFYYPFVLATDWGVATLNIQDDYVAPEDGGGNLYQMVRYFENRGGTWTGETIYDLSGHALAATRQTLLEHSDLYETGDGIVHALFREFLGDAEGSASATLHYQLQSGTWTGSELATPSGCNLTRMIEVDDAPLFLCSTYDKSFLWREGEEAVEIEIPGGLIGAYPYLAAPRGGTALDEDVLDLLLISGASSEYPDGPARYVRIPKDLVD